jgi:hypothetical protein
LGGQEIRIAGDIGISGYQDIRISVDQENQEIRNQVITEPGSKMNRFNLIPCCPDTLIP